MREKYLTTNPKQTKKIGANLSKEIIKTFLGDIAVVIALKGELGGGKTTFVQGLAIELGIKEKILSPTFVILKRFKIKNSKLKFNNFYHIDCYRIQKTDELINLGFKEIIKDPKNIVVVEWAENIRKILPNNTFWIQFSFIDKNTRQIIFNYQSLKR